MNFLIMMISQLKYTIVQTFKLVFLILMTLAIIPHAYHSRYYTKFPLKFNLEKFHYWQLEPSMEKIGTGPLFQHKRYKMRL